MSAYSEYYKGLRTANSEVAQRYLQKLKVVDNIDPFNINEKDLSVRLADVPKVMFGDIWAYVVETHSYYTRQQMKAFKSLKAFKYFDAGFVQDVGFKIVRNKTIVLGQVKHSQRMQEKPLQAWIICAEDGSIISAHCTCMAGTSEVCSHVGAILFALEFAYRNKDTPSCTDVKSLWPVPVKKQVPIVPVDKMIWGAELSNTSTQSLNVPPIEQDELRNFLQDIANAGRMSALARVVEPFATNMRTDAQIVVHNKMYMYNSKYESLTYKELLKVVVNFAMSEDECALLESNTRKQSESKEWFLQRAGRITASNFKAACRTSIVEPSLSLIKHICYPVQMTFSSKQTAWGKSHEKTAIKSYVDHQQQHHVEFTYENVGLLVSPKHPQFAASPDGLVNCICCSWGALEVKCPYTLRNKDVTIKNFAKYKSSFLTTLPNGSVGLNKNHAYYYQVQMQINVTTLLEYCDFVVWSPYELFVERVSKDEIFWKSASERALTFHSAVIIPELLAAYFTRKANNDIAESVCLCNATYDGRPMIKCGNDECLVQWFHLECTTLTGIPRYFWLCDACKGTDAAGFPSTSFQT